MGDADRILDVIVVGCGIPKKSMGWKHAQNLLGNRIKNARLKAIVEPFLLSEEAETLPAHNTFNDWTRELPHGVQIAQSTAELELDNCDNILCVIATRTPDLPAAFEEMVNRGVRSFYLEKPGAKNAMEFQHLLQVAYAAEARVAIGYIKNAANFVRLGLEEFKSSPRTTPSNDDLKSPHFTGVTIYHGNSYDDSSLDECFARNSEGMLKNMACHELAIAVKYFGLTAKSLKDVYLHLDETEYETRGSFSDFRKIMFSIKPDGTKNILRFNIDRCGGDRSGLQVGDLPMHTMPNEQEKVELERKMAEDPDMQPYFFLQNDIYCDFLGSVTEAMISQREFSSSVMTLENAFEVLKIAEVLTPAFKHAVKRNEVGSKSINAEGKLIQGNVMHIRIAAPQQSSL